MYEFRAAPWATSLKISSALVTALVMGVGYGVLVNIPPRGPVHTIGVIVALAIPAMLLLSVLFIVTGFGLDAHSLHVRRLAWSARIELTGMREIRRDPDAIKGSIRIMGNGGLFSFSGIYRSRKLGRYRLFATDPEYAVVMIHSSGTVVVTPADPELFIERARQLFPAALHTPNEGSRSTPHPHIRPIS